MLGTPGAPSSGCPRTAGAGAVLPAIGAGAALGVVLSEVFSLYLLTGLSL